MALSEANLHPGLRELSLSQCKNVTDMGVAWLAENKNLRLLLKMNVYQTAVTYTSLRAVRQSFKLAELCKEGSVLGLVPINRADDWLYLERFGETWTAAAKIQVSTWSLAKETGCLPPEM